MNGSVGVVEWPILILEGREGWEWVQFSRRMGGKEGRPKKMEGTQVCGSPCRKLYTNLNPENISTIIDPILPLNRLSLFHRQTVTFYPNHEPPFCGCLGGAGSSGEPDFHPSILEAAKAVVLAKVNHLD